MYYQFLYDSLLATEYTWYIVRKYIRTSNISDSCVSKPFRYNACSSAACKSQQMYRCSTFLLLYLMPYKVTFPFGALGPLYSDQP